MNLKSVDLIGPVIDLLEQNLGGKAIGRTWISS